MLLRCSIHHAPPVPAADLKTTKHHEIICDGGLWFADWRPLPSLSLIDLVSDESSVSIRFKIGMPRLLGCKRGRQGVLSLWSCKPVPSRWMMQGSHIIRWFRLLTTNISIRSVLLWTLHRRLTNGITFQRRRRRRFLSHGSELTQGSCRESAHTIQMSHKRDLVKRV